jgi:hypothetical protein
LAVRWSCVLTWEKHSHFKADTKCACVPINMNDVYLSKN